MLSEVRNNERELCSPCSLYHAYVAASDGNLAIAHSDDPAAWNRFVDQVNTSIDSLDLEFRHLIDESTGRELYTLASRFH
jgi:hypothetical protein